MTNIPNFAPGCFGSALAFQPEHMICRACPFNSQCEPLHLENVARLREKLGIQPPQRRGPKQKPARMVAADGTALTLPIKVQRLVERLDKSAFHVTEKLVRGENPFEGKIPFLAIACHLLLNREGPLQRSMLSLAFVHKLGWSKNTSDAHARMTFQALAHIGAIVDTEAGAVLKKD